MAEGCEQFCPTIQSLKESMNAYKPEDRMGNFRPGLAQMQLSWGELYAQALLAAEQCSGPIVIDSVDVVKGLFRKRIETVHQYECGLVEEQGRPS